MHGPSSSELTSLECLDIALAQRLLPIVGKPHPEESAQRLMNEMRRPAAEDARFLASLLRLRGLVLSDDDALAVLHGDEGRLSPLSQEFRLLRGLAKGLNELRERAMEGIAPDGWFFLTLFREMTLELPRFRNNELRRGPPWDALLYTTYPKPEELHFLLETFDVQNSFRDRPELFAALHPVRQGFRIMWRFARIAPFADFNAVVAWLGMNAWLQWKGYPLIPAVQGDQTMLARLVSGPPPKKVLTLESRLLAEAKRSVA